MGFDHPVEQEHRRGRAGKLLSERGIAVIDPGEMEKADEGQKACPKKARCAHNGS